MCAPSEEDGKDQGGNRPVQGEQCRRYRVATESLLDEKNTMSKARWEGL